MDFNSEVSLIGVAKLQYQTSSAGLNIPEPVPLVQEETAALKKKKNTEEEATAGLAAAKEVSVYAVVATVLLHLDGIFRLNEEQKTLLKAFICGKSCCLSTPDWQKFG